MDNPNPFTKPEPNPDLAFFTDDQLVDELKSRADDLIFAARFNRQQDVDLIHVAWCGDMMACMGLAQHVSNRAHASYMSDCRKADDYGEPFRDNDDQPE